VLIGDLVDGDVEGELLGWRVVGSFVGDIVEGDTEEGDWEG